MPQRKVVIRPAGFGLGAPLSNPVEKLPYPVKEPLRLNSGGTVWLASQRYFVRTFSTLGGAAVGFAVLGLIGAVSDASAATASCGSSSTRLFTIEGVNSPTCISGPTVSGIAPMLGAGFTLLDDDGVYGGQPTSSAFSSSSEGFLNLSGASNDNALFTIDQNFGAFSSFALVVQANTLGTDPDYAVFTFASSDLSGSFSVAPFANNSGLKGAALYGVTTPVPGPLAGAGVVPILGLGFVALRRRKQKLAA